MVSIDIVNSTNNAIANGIQFNWLDARCSSVVVGIMFDLPFFGQLSRDPAGERLLESCHHSDLCVDMVVDATHEQAESQWVWEDGHSFDDLKNHSGEIMRSTNALVSKLSIMPCYQHVNNIHQENSSVKHGLLELRS